jgi:hypothetical protein
LIKEVKKSSKGSYRGGTKKEPFEYSGSDDSLNRWIDALELFFYINTTPTRLQYSVAKQYLKGNALLVIELYERQQKAKTGANFHRMTWGGLKKKLRKEFHNEMAVYTLDSVYQRRSQGDKESAKDYIDCIMDLGSRLNKDSNDIKSRIIAGFRTDIHDRIRLHTPKSLQHLRNMADIIEDSVNHERKSYRKSQLSKVDVPSDMDSVCTVAKMINEPYVKQLETLAKTVEKLQVTNRAPADYSRNRSQSPHPRKCFECGSEEHLVRECPKFQARSAKDPESEIKSSRSKRRFYSKKKKDSNSSSEKSESDGKPQPQSWAPGQWSQPPPSYPGWNAPPWYNQWGPPSGPPPQPAPPAPAPTPVVSAPPITNPPATRQTSGNV